MIMCTGLTPESVQDAAKQMVKGRVIGASADRMAKQNAMIEKIRPSNMVEKKPDYNMVQKPMPKKKKKQ